MEFPSVVADDPYERKLFNMFNSYDTEKLGTLDKDGLKKLCNSLELKDQGRALIHSILKDNKCSRITFKCFKDALLNFLGSELEEEDEEKSLFISQNSLPNEDNLPDSPGREISPKLIVGTKKYGRRSRPQSLITNSSESESENNDTYALVPNIDIKNSNKVKRSSSQCEIRKRRPLSGTTKLKRCSSLPAQYRNQKNREQLIKNKNSSLLNTELSSVQQNQLTSSIESLDNLDFENLSHTIYEIWKNYGNEIGTNFLNCSQLEIVCERVGLNKVAGKVAEEVFEKLNLNLNDRICFNDFLGLIQNDSTTTYNYNTITITASPSSIRLTTDETDDLISNSTIPTTLILQNDITCSSDIHVKDITAYPVDSLLAGSIIDMWRKAGINEPKLLLLNLGFDDENINVSQLLSTLEEEIRSLNGENQITVLKAALVLRKAEILSLQKISRHIIEENKKLRADCKEANKRASMLAQEIDERHTTIENNTKSEIRLLEQRHSEIVKELTTQLSNDREHWSSVNLKLDNRIKELEQEENQLKQELQTLYDENSALEREQIALQKQITDLLETNIKLNNEIIEIEEKQKNDEAEKDAEEVIELIDKITSLQVENANLRDKNDELVAEIEEINIELSKVKMKKNSRNSTNSITGGDSDTLSEDFDQISLGVKRRGDSPSKTRITEESPRLGKLRKCSDDKNELVGDWIALNAEMNSTMINSSSAATPTTSGFSQDFSSITYDDKDLEIQNLKDKISILEKELCDYKISSSETLNENTTKVELKSKEEINENGNGDIDFKARCEELENCLEQMQKAYEDCEDYWQAKLSEERQLFEKERHIYEDEQQESDKKFEKVMEKIREYEEQFNKGGRLSPIEENSILEQQYADLETECETIKINSQIVIEEKTKEIEDLQKQIKQLQEKLNESLISNKSNNSNNLLVDVNTPASSSINYLLNQSTIQIPARDYQNPNWNVKPKIEINIPSFSDIVQSKPLENDFENHVSILPIQKPMSPNCNKLTSNINCQISSNSANSIVSLDHSVQETSDFESTNSKNPDAIKEELKNLKSIEVQLKEQIKDLVLKRDSLVMELQQLQEAKPALEKAIGRTAHPALTQRVNQLEQKNRHLQNIIRQQQQYAESFMHQSWQQQRQEIIELRNRLDAQARLITDQIQRLANANVFVKELCLENSHLNATIQRLEQQRNRATTLIHQQHHQGLTGLP